MRELFKNITNTKPTPTTEYFKHKCQLILTGKVGECYMKKIITINP